MCCFVRLCHEKHLYKKPHFIEGWFFMTSALPQNNLLQCHVLFELQSDSEENKHSSGRRSISKTIFKHSE